MSTVLVIDDEAPVREMIRAMLTSAGYRVVEAENGVAGVALYRQQQPQLVITDILMPDKDGIEAVREIRQINPQARIVAVSGGGRAKYTNFLAVAKEFGAAATLEKPFRREELLAVVGKLLPATTGN